VIADQPQKRRLIVQLPYLESKLEIVFQPWCGRSQFGGLPARGMFSLLEMLRFYAQDFLAIARSLGEMDAYARANKFNRQLDQPLDNETRTRYTETMKSFDVMCRNVHLDSASDQIARMVDGLGNGDLTGREFMQMFSELHNRIEDDFSHHLLFAIPRQNASYYEQRGDFFDDDKVSVSKEFPSALEDIEEAGKCYATDRSTACVFHLMHVMEYGLRALGKALNDLSLDPKTNPSWEKILGRCNKELEKPYDKRSPEWVIKNQFFCEATANLRAVKDAWRNPGIHIDKKYDPDEALDILNAVRAFMRHLAKELSE
jgi:hypothetical protein